MALLGAHPILHVSRIRVNGRHPTVFERPLKQPLMDPSNTTIYFYLNIAKCFGLQRLSSGHHYLFFFFFFKVRQSTVQLCSRCWIPFVVQ